MKNMQIVLVKRKLIAVKQINLAATSILRKIIVYIIFTISYDIKLIHL